MTTEARKTLYFLIMELHVFWKAWCNKNDIQEHVMQSVLLSCTYTSMQDVLLYCYLLHIVK
jgi:hypothetical protein